MEIKRYGLGQGKLSSDSGVSVYGPQIVELDGGEYYKASDVDEYLESIGAGGVNGRITSKTIEQHRVEFEEWASSKGLFTGAYNKVRESHLVDWMWLAWKAAKGVKE